MAAELSIVRRRTEDGFTLYLMCPACDQPLKRVNPQSPVWSLWTDMDSHDRTAHYQSTSDDAVGKMYARQPTRRIQTLELPDVAD